MEAGIRSISCSRRDKCDTGSWNLGYKKVKRSFGVTENAGLGGDGEMDTVYL